MGASVTLTTPSGWFSLYDIVKRDRGGDAAMLNLAREYEAQLTLNNDLPLVMASGNDKDEGEFEEPWEYNKNSHTMGLDDGMRFYKTGVYSREDIMGMRGSAIGIEHDKFKKHNKSQLWRAHQVFRRVGDISLDQEHDSVYGDPDKDPNSFLGIMPRYDIITNTKGVVVGGTHAGKLSPYVTLDAGGTRSGDLSSLIILVPGEHEVCRIYPADSDYTGGISYEQGTWQDQIFTDAEGKERVRTRATDKFQSIMGIAIKNRRACVRIANCDFTSTDATVWKKFQLALRQAFTVIPPNLRSRAIVYCADDATPYLQDWYDNKVQAVTYEGAKPHNLGGDFGIDNHVFRPLIHLTMGEPQLVNPGV